MHLSKFIRAADRPRRTEEPPATLWGWANVRWGVREGWWFARRYLVYGIVLMVLGGSALLKRNRITALGVVAVYGLGIPSIGAIVGALRPLCRTSLGAAFVGVIAMLPITSLTVILVAPRSLGLGLLVGITVGFAIVYGALGALYLRGVYNR